MSSSIQSRVHLPKTTFSTSPSTSPLHSPSQPQSQPQTTTDSQTLLLPSGRTLGFATYGSPTGRPLFFLHGFPSSRLEAAATSRLASRLNIRVISPDRPGFGLSTLGTPPAPARIVDYAADVRALADHLGLERFAVLGGSGGGPYALACAKELPDRLTAVGLMASAGPWDQGPGMKEVPWFSKWLYIAVTYVPGGLRVAVGAIMGALKWVVGTKSVTKRLDKWIGSLKKEESQSEDLTIEERRTKVVRTFFEAFAQGGAGFVHEARLLSSNYGFRFEDIKFDRVKLWHGAKDYNAPLSIIKYVAEKIPNCELKVFEEDTHFTILKRLEGILDELVPADKEVSMDQL